MISRRLLRIKALMVLYAFNRKDGSDLAAADKELMQSIAKTYDLYHYLLLLVLEIADIAAEKIEIAANKNIPTDEDLNPNTRFIDNKLVRILGENRALRSYIKTAKLSWTDHPELPRKLYGMMLEWEDFNSYMNKAEEGFSEDRKFIISLIVELIAPSEDLQALLEELSIYWNDDLSFLTIMLEKTLRGVKVESGPDHKLLPIFKNKEDEIFVRTLVSKTILNSEKYVKLIDSNTTNWEIERVALMDILVMQLALSEIVEFDEIPVKVTLNEYIEIAKYYCTTKSSTFVNGILDKIVREMRKNEIFKKSGRGLVGEPGIEKKD
jgi:N utilization substance protein B